MIFSNITSPPSKDAKGSDLKAAVKLFSSLNVIRDFPLLKHPFGHAMGLQKLEK